MPVTTEPVQELPWLRLARQGCTMIDVRRSSYKQGNMHSFKTAVGSRILGSLEAPRMFQDDISPNSTLQDVDPAPDLLHTW